MDRHFTKAHEDKKARRHELYKMMKSNQKEALLKTMRTNKTELSCRNIILRSSSSTEYHPLPPNVALIQFKRGKNIVVPLFLNNIGIDIILIIVA